MTYRTYIVTSIDKPHIYLGEYYAETRSQAKAQCSMVTGTSVFQLRAYLGEQQ